MILEVEKLENDVVLVQLIGRLDMKGTMEIDDQFTFQTASKKAAVLVDMSQVEFIASIGMRTLLSNARAVEKRGGKMGLLSPVDLVKEALDTAGIGQLIPMYDDQETAVADLLTKVQA